MTESSDRTRARRDEGSLSVERGTGERKVRIRGIWIPLLLLACTHSDAWVTPPIVALPPFGTGADVQLTYNVDQNYWPAWTQDGRGILYAFVNLENTAHRCLGLLPAAGGSRIWELCDNRAVRDDSVSSYSAYALDSNGRLLLVEALSARGFASSFPYHVRLQLTDTAAPYVRTTLLTLPVTVGNITATWLSDLAWTGPNTFLALGQQFASAPHCGACECQPCPTDSMFADSGGVVLRGTIIANQVMLQAIAGTEGATGYSLAENGASIVFTLKYYPRLFKVPVTGGPPSPTPGIIAQDLTTELVGVSCKASTCIAAKDAISLTHTFNDPVTGNGYTITASFLNGPMELHRVSLSSGTDDVIQSVGNGQKVLATPQISPVSGDIVIQLGGVWGHLQTHATAGRGNGELHLLKGIVP